MITDSDVELLLTFAEVSAAFIGFSAIAGIIGRQIVDAGYQHSNRLRSIVMGSILLLVAAFIPLLVARFDVESVWRVSSAILFPTNLLVAYLIIKGDVNVQVTRADRFYMYGAYVSEVPVEVFLLLNVLGLFSNYAGAFYLTVIFVLLLQLALAFGMFVHSLLLQQQGVDDSVKSD